MRAQRGWVEGKEWRVLRRERNLNASDSLRFPNRFSLTYNSLIRICLSIDSFSWRRHVSFFFHFFFHSQFPWGCCCAGVWCCLLLQFVCCGWMNSCNLVQKFNSMMNGVCVGLMRRICAASHSHESTTKLNFYLNFRYVTNRTDIDLW